MKSSEKIELSIKGMDCAECAHHVENALITAPGVQSASVYLISEKAILEVDSSQVDFSALEKAVKDAGYSVSKEKPDPVDIANKLDISRSVGRLTAGLFAAVILVVVVGEFFGLFEFLTDLVPLPLGAAFVAAAGFPVFKKVAAATWRLQIISHTLMTVGVLAALLVGEWVTALVVVFFMRIGDYVEQFTSDQARKSLQLLIQYTPATARVLRNGDPVEVSVDELAVGDIVEIRPGDRIPVDGEVIGGQATIDQSSITGESIPVDVGVGASVYTATLAQSGSIRVRSEKIGADSTFGQIITMVEEAESQRSDVQRFADKFSTYFLPIVAAIALITFVVTGDALATAAVLVVACSCSIAMATPIAMLASIGAAAKSGLLIKGGKYIEALERADILLIDKTGTLTLGKPKVSEVRALNGIDPSSLLSLAASAERYSEHPLAEAVRQEANIQQLPLYEPDAFESVPGEGISASVGGRAIRIGNLAFVSNGADFDGGGSLGETLVYVSVDEELAGVVSLTDTMRTEVPEAISELREMGLKRIELLTGDNKDVAARLAEELNIDYRAELLPQDKISIVKEYQEHGHIVVMIGDGVNDAPAIAQADVGIAMGAIGSRIALEAADMALITENWRLVPTLFKISRKTMGVVRMNLGFTGIYNLVGLSLAAVGILPPVLAAAAQSIPDLGMLANSSRLLKS